MVISRSPTQRRSLDHARPSASIQTLKLRADLLARTRTFLIQRGYWEVETPLLSTGLCVDAHIEPFQTTYLAGADTPTPAAAHDGGSGRGSGATDGQQLYLQTSPELGMKRLLAAGSGSIFQITRSFRNGELGRLHNPEFTIVEWYRVGGHYHKLMQEVGQLVSELLQGPRPRGLTYCEAFCQYAGCHPFTASEAGLKALAEQHGFIGQATSRDDWLNFLLAALVEPQLGMDQPVFLYDYPASQAALARVRQGPPAVAERFELYASGLELCNGYQELTDPDGLQQRIAEQNRIRQAQGKPPLPAHPQLQVAMEAGLPDCTGVALGFDRLVMVAAGVEALADVLAFDFPRA